MPLEVIAGQTATSAEAYTLRVTSVSPNPVRPLQILTVSGSFDVTGPGDGTPRASGSVYPVVHLESRTGGPDVLAPVSLVLGTQISATVPAGTLAGEYWVRVEEAGVMSTAQPLEILPMGDCASGCGGACTASNTCCEQACTGGTCDASGLCHPTGGGTDGGMPDGGGTPTGGTCSVGSDCASTYCVGSVCCATACPTGDCSTGTCLPILDAGTGPDGGGGGGQPGDFCSIGSDCASTYCVSSVCCATACPTGDCSTGTCLPILDAGTGPDGGGGGGQPGDVCSVGADCASTYCVSSVCCTTSCVGGDCSTGVCQTFPDGGTVTDGGTMTDGGTGPDGGTVTDGGTGTDAGTTPDAGTATTPQLYGCLCGQGGSSPGWAVFLLVLVVLRVDRRRRRGLGLWVILLGAVLAAGPARAQSAAPQAAKAIKKVAVLELQAGPGVDTKLAQVITQSLTASIQARGPSVVSSQDIKSALGFEAQKQLLGCKADSACLAQIGGALGVDHVVAGSLARIGESYVMNLQLIDIVHASVSRRYSRRVRGSSAEAFLDIVDPAARALFPEVRAAPGGVARGAPPVAEPSGPGRPLGIVVGLRGQVFPGAPLGGAIALSVGWQPIDALTVSLGGLAARPFGAYLRVQWVPFNVGGRVRPLLAAEVPLLFSQPLAAGLSLSPGVAVGITPWLDLTFEVPVSYELAAPAGAQRFWIFLAGGVALRF